METTTSYFDRETDVGNFSRTVSVVAGATLLISALSGKKPALKAIAGGYLLFRGFTGHCPMSEMLATDFSDSISIKQSITVNRTRNEAYRFWRELSNLPLFMKHLKSVTETSESRSEWVAAIPGKLGTLNWEAEITVDIENEMIGWMAVEGATIENMGHVTFKDAGKFGTEVHIDIHYKAPVGKIGEAVSRLFNPVFSQMVKEDIKNFKRYIETGEIPTTEGQSGRS